VSSTPGPAFFGCPDGRARRDLAAVSLELRGSRSYRHREPSRLRAVPSERQLDARLESRSTLNNRVSVQFVTFSFRCDAQIRGADSARS